MKLRSPWMIRIAAALVAFVTRCLLATVRVRLAFADGRVHPADPAANRYLYAFWHEGMFAPLSLKWKVRVLISEHADGELITQVCRWFGIGSVRGSQAHGGSRALLDMIRNADGAHLGVTPDGPQGPRRKLKPGVVMAASHAGLPILPFGIGFSRAWRSKSWDQLAVPRPFSSMVLVFGEPIEVPQPLERRDLRRWTELVESRMTELTVAAEAWAERLDREGARAAPPDFPASGDLRRSA